jgi:ribonuclease VapC
VNSNKVVLDASAILAVIHGEHGSGKLSAALLANSVVSSVNLAEVHSKLVAKGWDAEQAWEDCLGVVDQVVPFSMEHAKRTGSLILATRSIGLSLGDRACLALALELKAVVYTADRSWKNLKIDLRINSIR